MQNHETNEFQPSGSDQLSVADTGQAGIEQGETVEETSERLRNEASAYKFQAEIYRYALFEALKASRRGGYGGEIQNIIEAQYNPATYDSRIGRPQETDILNQTYSEIDKEINKIFEDK